MVRAVPAQHAAGLEGEAVHESESVIGGSVNESVFIQGENFRVREGGGVDGKGEHVESDVVGLAIEAVSRVIGPGGGIARLEIVNAIEEPVGGRAGGGIGVLGDRQGEMGLVAVEINFEDMGEEAAGARIIERRSEERRVGKECRSRW